LSYVLNWESHIVIFFCQTVNFPRVQEPKPIDWLMTSDQFLKKKSLVVSV